MDNPIRNIEISDISSRAFMDEEQTVKILLENVEPLAAIESDIMKRAVDWTQQIRETGLGHGVEAFLHSYSLNTSEGVALMCLAEALLRIPDKNTADMLINDCFKGHEWTKHTISDDWMISLSGWGLFLTGKIIDFGQNPQASITNTLKKLVNRVGEPLIRESLKKAMQLIGGQFVLGENIEQALKHSSYYKAYRFSYDILGEGARSDEQAKNYTNSYLEGISLIAKTISKDTPLFSVPSISVKLSALHARYQLTKREQVMNELLPRLIEIILHAKQAGMMVSIDAEESSRLDIELEIFEKLLENPEFAGWNGIGFVLQAYQKRAFYIIDWLAQKAKKHNIIIPVRLVKGAYWDSEIKWAQLLGLPSYPVFTRKEHTDISYMACAAKILAQCEIFYPQFATHNARTISTIISLSEKYGWEKGSFEFQRLHGMGEALHNIIVKHMPSRIYAPIGAHKDLLAYLIRRLLENGANSSFVHLLLDRGKSVQEILADPVATAKANMSFYNPSIPLPQNLYGTQRKNSAGIDFGNKAQLKALLDGTAPFIKLPLPDIKDTSMEELHSAITTAKKAFPKWEATTVEERAKILERCGDLIEESAHELIALCVREAGKTLPDSISEIREAADFCRFYAAEARMIMNPNLISGPTGENNVLSMHPRGIFACISPWNFPLAIFIGQVVASLVTGNCVIAKPAEQTPVIAKRAVDILYEAGIPRDVLHLIAGKGETIGAELVTNKSINGVVFTGSLETSGHIQKSLATRGDLIPLIAETGGQNCMVVDSSALIEQAVDDIIISAFNSAGQRCSALRVLYVQQDIADKLLTLLTGAMQELKIGDPYKLDTDIGAVIDAQAQAKLLAHIAYMKKTAKFIASSPLPENLAGYFVAPHIFEISDISEPQREIFGPILHIIRFPSDALEQVADNINSTGYGLTFGIHSRINKNINLLAAKVRAGNIYVNRNMIGATVGVQPFGGEGLSGTGFKAGGPHYLLRFLSERTTSINIAAIGGNIAMLTEKPT